MYGVPVKSRTMKILISGLLAHEHEQPCNHTDREDRGNDGGSNNANDRATSTARIKRPGACSSIEYIIIIA